MRWSRKEEAAATRTAAGINPFCNVQDARVGETPAPLLLFQPPCLAAPFGQSVPVRLRRLLDNFYSTGNTYSGVGHPPGCACKRGTRARPPC